MRLVMFLENTLTSQAHGHSRRTPRRSCIYTRLTAWNTLKEERIRFCFFRQRRQKLLNESQLERIHYLVIPPAWKNVLISPKKNSYLQATGIDEKGRK